MARIRTARVIAAAAALPFAVAVMSGVAQADNGSFADDGSNSNASVSTQAQSARGDGNNTNNANNATVNGNGAVVDQSNETHNETNTVVFTNLW
ncbi:MULTISPECIES: hypothetical protein [unclassified Streptomyces]|uniref:hypothetical protein n=1 Tax=unclassified Streptomyces TaxID=2593676 RepID=UPI002DDAE959|nr:MULTISPECIES: hypothetical protein [unclassified Streptomyces]WSA93739.1 hypothetical protein OIE63_20725 [Streptomyces sp. NBC_01795]WSB78110.1 hypothetical protein OHB04_21565 [Streptomyces sp. NBC_01775]WSS13638.1 hypothetical protein OG533_18415 [Streptomyces sp. NBC_01186]WSS42434.1 hypothetical protein OG220_19030 [Streptomyces sp. NBC_01187]